MFAWGLNNHGQLGIGNKYDTSVPTRIKEIDPYEGDYIVEIAGGEHHSVARTKDGIVYCWGRNDEGQLGIGDTFGAWRKKKAQEEQEKLLKEAEEKEKEPEQQPAEPKPEGEGGENAEPAQPVTTAKKAKKSAKKEEVEKEEDLKYIFYFYRPQIVESLYKLELEEGDNESEVRKNITQIAASGHYTYALEKSGSVYSWGIGENYVLGSREDDNQYKPYLLHPKMFEENKVAMVSLGTQHVVALGLESAEAKVPELDVSKFVAPAKTADTPEQVVEENGGQVEEPM